MGLSRSLRYGLLLCVLLEATLGHCAEGQPRLTIGILPAFNGGGDNFGPVFGQHLTLKLFQQLQSDTIQTVLLNPGGRYLTSDDDWLLNYGKKSAADFLVITTLLQTQVPEKGNCTITVQTEVLNLKSETRLGPWKSVVEISKHDARLDYGSLRMNLLGSYYIGPSRVFEKQPLGKAMLAIAGQVRSQVLQVVKTDAVAVTGQQRSGAPDGACDVHLKVLYASKGAASKSYTIFVNGEDESLGVQDGVLLLRGKSGMMLLQLTLNDAPYKLPKQDLYQAATDVDCSKPDRQLNIRIGAAGEALLGWQ